MEKDIKVWLADIRQAIVEINSFLPEKKIFSEFQRDLKGKRAVERNVEIIGEAVNRILKVNPQIQITSARKIVDTRNRISHGYDSVSDDIIWAIAPNFGIGRKQTFIRINTAINTILSCYGTISTKYSRNDPRN